MNYDLIMLIINIVMMVTSIVACIITILTKNAVVKIGKQMRTESTIKNKGKNSGVMAGTISGGVKIE